MLFLGDSLSFNQRRWLIYSILAFAYMLVFFQRIAPAVVASDLMQTFNTTGVALGSLAAMYYYIYTAMQIPSGVLADTLGTRLTVSMGGLVAGLGSILFGLAPSFEIASIGRFLVGLGVSVIFIGMMKNNSVWFSERYYATISGLTLFLGNVGAILGAYPLAYVLNWFSWRMVFVAIGGFSLLLAFLSLVWIRNRPQDAGFLSIREQEGKLPHAAIQRHWFDELKKVLVIRELWTGFWMHLGLTGSFFAFIGLWAIPFLSHVHHFSRDVASHYTTTALIAFALVALGGGWLSDKIKQRKPLLLFGGFLYLFVWLCFWIYPTITGPYLYLLFLLLGICAGCFVLVFTVAKELVPPALAGMGISLVNTGLFLGAAITQPLFGWLLDFQWNGAMNGDARIYTIDNYQIAMSLMLGFASIALISAMRVVETYRKI
ncbi:MFS transporter [Beggiatoa leptomitoformis]|uniref:Lysosomal dipeptide transporter MFSD1 n=1 Tax=Beggiatoa leptomitoformis TaxID=288004 RepID=A0A2N9YGW1_9GAMM|nr:MFS transporter [Beggiatoa leptomitoformis]ALG68081.1 MFS transporter [Beggiatoa leptomitoformis]AUI69625.1 MFS transporter [Beggiatoa leptomitoformis]